MKEEKKFHAKIQSGQIKVYSPHDFEYYETLAAGAYGSVRKCKFKDENFIGEGVMENSST